MLTERQIEFIGSARADLSAFPDEVRYLTGHALREIQRGNMHPNAKHMHGNLRDVIEISANDESGKRTFRTTCTIKIGQIVYVLHAFQKKAHTGSSTPMHDLELIG